MRIELGCGPDHNPEYYGIDARPLPGVDLVWDLEQVPLPLPDECCDEIVSSHTLEHITNLIPLMNECHRLLKPSGVFRATVPQVCDGTGTWHASAFQDPTHVRFFVPATWLYFIEDHPLYHFGRIYGIRPWKLIAFRDDQWVATVTLQNWVNAVQDT
jgi:predicted SAM-dependent methyltransferase